MERYSKAYLDEVVETQGRLFDEAALRSPGIDVEDFIENYMKSSTREAMDQGQAYVLTMDDRELWDYFLEKDHFSPRKGKDIPGFVPDWIGRFYAYYQWYYNMPSRNVVEQVPVSFLVKAYNGMHDLDLELAVRKVGS